MNAEISITSQAEEILEQKVFRIWKKVMSAKITTKKMEGALQPQHRLN